MRRLRHGDRDVVDSCVLVRPIQLAGPLLDNGLGQPQNWLSHTTHKFNPFMPVVIRKPK